MVLGGPRAVRDNGPPQERERAPRAARARGCGRQGHWQRKELTAAARKIYGYRNDV